MEQGTAPDPAMWSLRSRGPAHAVSHLCLDAQRSARPRCLLGRLFGFDPLHPDAVSWYRAALAERRVGRMLTELGREWRVLHAVPHGDGGSGIDHLVIGPPGVFTITTSAAVAADLEARAASRSLTRAAGMPVAVAAIVVTDARPTDSATVMTSHLVRRLRDLPTVFGPDLVASVARVAEEWTTWRPFGLDAGHLDPNGDFERLHAQVTAARTRRVIWQIGGVVALIAAVGSIASGILS